jgi:uncharacterized protein YdeI (YjbR/CyaY-like superfamily)
LSEVGPFTPAEWEAWLEAHHETETEAWLVSWKKSTGKQELAYGEAVAVAMQFGWVDSLEKGIDAERFKQRWTPRRPRSNWTERNVALAKRLVAGGRMRPAGLRALEAAKSRGQSPGSRGQSPGSRGSATR